MAVTSRICLSFILFSLALQTGNFIPTQVWKVSLHYNIVSGYCIMLTQFVVVKPLKIEVHEEVLLLLPWKLLSLFFLLSVAGESSFLEERETSTFFC